MSTSSTVGPRAPREAPQVGAYRRGSRVRTTPAGTWFPALGPDDRPAGLLLLHPAVKIDVLTPTLARLAELRLRGVLPMLPDLVDQAGRNWLVATASATPTVADVLDDGAHRTPGNAAALLSDIAATLSEIHAAGLAHGAVGAHAAVIGPTGTALLADWGTDERATAEGDRKAWGEFAELLADRWCADSVTDAAALARAVRAAGSGGGLRAAEDELRELARRASRDTLAEVAARPPAPPRRRRSPDPLAYRSTRTAAGGPPSPPELPAPEISAPTGPEPAAAPTGPGPASWATPEQVPWATPEPSPRATPEPAPWTAPEPSDWATRDGAPWATPEPSPRATPEAAPWATPAPTDWTTPEAAPWATPEPAGWGEPDDQEIARQAELIEQQLDGRQPPGDTRAPGTGPSTGPVRPAETHPAETPSGDGPAPPHDPEPARELPLPPRSTDRAPSPARRRSPLTGRPALLAVLLATVLVAAVLVLIRPFGSVEHRSAPIPAGPMEIRAVSVNSERQATVCLVVGKILTNGQAGWVVYRWVGENGSQAVSTVSSAAGSFQLEVGLVWQPNSPPLRGGSVTLQVLEPTPSTTANVLPLSCN